MSSTRKGLLLACWIAVVAVLGWIVDRNLVVGTDLRLFMPSPQTAQERLVLEEIGEGPASRLLLLAISGPDPQAVADTSIALAADLRDSPEFRWVANGQGDVESIPERLLAYRYLLSPTLDAAPLDASFLRRSSRTALHDLASPAAGFLEPWLPRDPTLELLKLAESWQPARQPRLLYDVWFDASGRQALLVAETRARGLRSAGPARRRRCAAAARSTRVAHGRRASGSRRAVQAPSRCS